MPALATTGLVLTALLLAVGGGLLARKLLPEHHRDGDTKDAIKLAMGLVATMSALLLSLLVASAKGTFDTSRSETIAMSSKFAFLDKTLEGYGPEADGIRAEIRGAVEDLARAMWRPMGTPPPIHRHGLEIFQRIHELKPANEIQSALKTEAGSLALQLGELRSLMIAQSIPSIAHPLLAGLVIWLFVIFFAFSFLAPVNLSARTALVLSALSVSGAIFLVLELDSPFTGILSIPRATLGDALASMGTATTSP